MVGARGRGKLDPYDLHVRNDRGRVHRRQPYMESGGLMLRLREGGQVPASPVLSRRSLGAELRRLREEAGVPVARAAEELDCSVSKISRIETGVTAPRRPEVDLLLRLYGEDALDHRDELVRLASEGRQTAWYDEFGDLLAPGSTLHRYIGLEGGASVIRSYSCGWLPGLIQTEDYARAVYAVARPGRPLVEIDRLIEFRLARKAVLAREPNPPRVAALIDEAVIRRPAQGPGVMRAQLQHMCDLIENGPPNLEIRLLPFSLGLHGLLGGEFTVMAFDRGEDDIVFFEGQDGAVLQEKPEVVCLHGDRLDAAWKLGVEGRELVAVLRAAADTFD